ncbi:MAG: plasmid recombination protein [Eubacteriales bacterium]
MMGKGSITHNNRKHSAQNVDKSRTWKNIVFIQEDLKSVYHELFDDSVSEYNRKQVRKDRKITNYYEKIANSKQEKLFHEIVLQIGNKDDMNVCGENGKVAETILSEYMEAFQERNPYLRVFNAVIHMDEETPHLHIDCVPFTTSSVNRGPSTRVSLKKALEQQGFLGGSKGETEWKQWTDNEKEQLASIMKKHGIGWSKLGTHKSHLSVLDYKKQERAKEVQLLEIEEVVLKKRVQALDHDVEMKSEEINEIASLVKQQVNGTGYYDTAEEWKTPTPKFNEKAKAYKERCIDTLIQNLKQVIRDIQLQYLNLRMKYWQQNEEVTKLTRTIEKLKSKIQNQDTEIKYYKSKLEDYEPLIDAVPLEMIEKIVFYAEQQKRLNEEYQVWKNKQYNR